MNSVDQVSIVNCHNDCIYSDSESHPKRNNKIILSLHRNILFSENKVLRNNCVCNVSENIVITAGDTCRYLTFPCSLQLCHYVASQRARDSALVCEAKGSADADRDCVSLIQRPTACWDLLLQVTVCWLWVLVRESDHTIALHFVKYASHCGAEMKREDELRNLFHKIIGKAVETGLQTDH